MLRDDLVAGAKGAAAYTGLTERQIYHLTENNHLQAIRMGRKMYFRKSELDAAFRANAG